MKIPQFYNKERIRLGLINVDGIMPLYL